MFESLSPFLNSLLTALVLGAAGILVAFLISLLFSKLLSRFIGITWSRFFGNLLALGIVVLVVKLILDFTGAVGTLVVLATAVTGALAIGSENIASDLIAGLKLFTSRPFRAGDLVQIGGHQGKVAEIMLTNTVLSGITGDRIVIRNADVLAGTIVNFSARAAHMIGVQITVPASQDLEKAIAAILEGLKGFSPESDDPAFKPGVVCEAVSGGQMSLMVRAYVSERLDYGEEKTRLLLATIQALKKKHIGFGD